MKQALIDTDTLSYFFRNKFEVVTKLDKYLQVFEFVNISVVTYYEVLNGLYFKDAKSQLSKFEQFVELNEVLPLTEDIAKKLLRFMPICEKQGRVLDTTTFLSHQQPSSTIWL